MKKAEITLQVGLDENNVPETINWSSTDGENTDSLPAKALFSTYGLKICLTMR